MGVPPPTGGTTVTRADPAPAVTVALPGTPDADNTTADDAVDALDVPETFVAVVVNSYDVPAVRPLTTHDVAGAVTTHEPPAGTDVTV